MSPPYADRWIVLGNRGLGAVLKPLDRDEVDWSWTCWAGPRTERGEFDKVGSLEAVMHFLDSVPG